MASSTTLRHLPVPPNTTQPIATDSEEDGEEDMWV